MNATSTTYRSRYRFEISRSDCAEDIPSEPVRLNVAGCRASGEVFARSASQARNYCKAMCRIPGLWTVRLWKGDRELEKQRYRIEISILAGDHA